MDGNPSYTASNLPEPSPRVRLFSLYFLISKNSLNLTGQPVLFFCVESIGSTTSSLWCDRRHAWIRGWTGFHPLSLPTTYLMYLSIWKWCGSGEIFFSKLKTSLYFEGVLLFLEGWPPPFMSGRPDWSPFPNITVYLKTF